MATLIAKDARIALGINTIARNIVYAILALRGLTRSITTLKDSVQIEQTLKGDEDSIDGTFNAKIDLTVLPEAVNKQGMNLLGYISNLTEATPESPPAIAPAIGLAEEMPDEPAKLTLERYLFWAGIVLACSTYPSQTYFKYTFNDRPTTGNPTLTLRFAIPFDYRKYLIRNNIIESIIQPFTHHITNPDQLPSSPWTIPPSPQFWRDPVADIAALTALTGQAPGTHCHVRAVNATYFFTANLPADADGDRYIAPDTQTDNEGWIKLGTGGDGGGGGGGPVYWDAIQKIQNKLTTFAPSTHGHPWSQITDKPTEFAPSAHEHAIAQVTGLSDALGQKADSNHTHTIEQISGLTASTARTRLEANAIYFINASTGSDSNDGKSAQTAFATFEKADAVTAQLDGNGYSVTLKCSGTFTNSKADFQRQYVGISKIIIDGDVDNPSNCTISITAGFCLRVIGKTPVEVKGIRFTSTGTSGIGIVCGEGTIAITGNCIFANLPTFHLYAERGKAEILQRSNYRIVGSTDANTPHNSMAHLVMSDGAKFDANGEPYTVNISGYINFSVGFVWFTRGGSAFFLQVSYSGGNITGKQFQIEAMCAVFNGTVPNFPGSISGTVNPRGYFGN